MITREDLARMYPRALPEWLDAMAELAPLLANHYGFNRLDWVHFLGQIGAETNGLSLARMQENMNFTTAKRIKEVYSYRLKLAINYVTTGRQKEPAWVRGKTVDQVAASLVRKPKELADIVYGGREGTGWLQGSKYVGRGPTQITHLNNYKAIGEEIARQPGGASIDLVATPEKLADDPELGIRSAFADWHIKGLSRWAQKDDCDTLSDALNTGNIRDNVKPHGLPERRRQTALAKSIWKREIDFGEDIVVASVPASVPESQAKPTIKELVKVSRKARWLVWVNRILKGIATLFTLDTVLSALDIAQDVIGKVKGIVTENGHVIAISAAILGSMAIAYVLSLMREDVEEGRATPSGEAGGANAA
jgi:predicted chitinase